MTTKTKKTDNKNFASVAGVSMENAADNKFDLWSVFPLSIFKPNPTVVVIRLSGVISSKVGARSGLNIESLNESIERAFKTPKLLAVCLVINSPGGSPVQSDLISSRIMSLSAEKDIPVYSFVEDIAASGGYWLACTGQEIYASRSSLIGNIGVISRGFGFKNVIDKLGIERRVYSEGKNKSILDPFEPVKNSDVKMLKNLQKHVHEHFIDHIKKSRKGRLTQNDDILFNGEFWCAETAVDFGLIDGIKDMYNFIKEQFGNDIKIKYVTPKESWFKRKMNISINADTLVSDTVESIKEEAISSKLDMY